ncbi:SpoIID/LytB domain-containing protein, partial [Patescibacteria group bacterium]|nr:SpoIID/LytB domain-containing protein [Patescibacteria group bacterium]MBU1868606.1 SpoIID/LytB domain-containing protein [Patescibacteria group bacterium]
RSAIVGPPPQDSNVYFSFWTYGYPHRVGMNQYGAYGRAKAGQGYKEILGKYYSLSPEAIVPYQASETIHVLGCQYGPPPWVEGGKSREVCESEGGTFYDTRIDFEEYIKGLGEMPSSWGSPDNAGMEALKAQAVAARSYVLYYTADGSSPICPSTNCQYYTGSNKGGYWEEAVNATNAEVILYENKPISAYYHSTSGGYTLNSEEVWTSPRPYLKGIRDVDAQGHYYDEISPWYHKAWGDQPWLSRDQVEDLLNAALLPESYNAYLPMPSAEEAQKPLTERGGGFTPEEILATLQKESVDSITNLKSLEVIGAEGKSTLLVRVYYEQGYIDIDAQRFRFVFNLRSPGTDAIWTSRFDIRTS